MVNFVTRAPACTDGRVGQPPSPEESRYLTVHMFALTRGGFE